jgi:hypothetical protein
MHDAGMNTDDPGFCVLGNASLRIVFSLLIKRLSFDSGEECIVWTLPGKSIRIVWLRNSIE